MVETDLVPNDVLEDGYPGPGYGQPNDGCLALLFPSNRFGRIEDTTPSVVTGWSSLRLGFLPPLIQFRKCAEAVVGVAGGQQVPGYLRVPIEPVALAVRTVRTSHLDALIPIQAHPLQADQHIVLVFLLGAGRVGVIDAENERTAGVARVQPVEQRRPGVADVQEPGWRRCDANPYRHSLPTGLARTPMPSTSTSIRSPGTTELMPEGVPVSTTSPGSRVITRVMNSINSATPNTMSAVEPDWRTSPLTRHSILSPSKGSSSVSIAGPSGQNVSKPLPRVHWPSLRCKSRAVTSLPAV